LQRYLVFAILRGNQDMTETGYAFFLTRIDCECICRLSATKTISDYATHKTETGYAFCFLTRIDCENI
jgi:hypothetical protein